MKTFSKTFLAAAVLTIGSLFISCSSDDSTIENPVITIDNAENIQIQNGTVISGQVTSSSKLVSVTFSYVRGSSADAFKVVSSFDDKRDYEFREVLANVTNDITGIKISATNKDGGIAEKTLSVMTQTPLSDPVSFRLGYPSNNLSNLPTSQYGVTYNSNTSAIEASFGGAFVMLSIAEYDAITTKEQLIAKYESGSKVLSFTVGSNNNFTSKYFISVEPSAYYLMEMTDLEFTPSDNVASFYMRR